MYSIHVTFFFFFSSHFDPHLTLLFLFLDQKCDPQKATFVAARRVFFVSTELERKDSPPLGIKDGRGGGMAPLVFMGGGEGGGRGRGVDRERGVSPLLSSYSLVCDSVRDRHFFQSNADHAIIHLTLGKRNDCQSAKKSCRH